ncbi:hypothetical protein FA95DRAFT_1459018, partial [Auriscalpium vulgare]
YPWVGAAVITSIFAHEFRSSDLWKLDVRNRDKKTKKTIGIGHSYQIEIVDEAGSDYRSASSLLIPLQTFFNIVLGGLSNSGSTASLLELSITHEWVAVYDYHCLFFDTRMREMSHANYAGWRDIDTKIQAMRLFGRLRAQ